MLKLATTFRPFPAPPSVAASALTPGPGLDPDGDSAWIATEPHVAFTATVALPAGWYRLRIAVAADDHHGLRKRGVLSVDDVALESFEWNDALGEDLIVRLPSPATSLRFDLHHATGTFRLGRFDLRPASRVRALLRAVRLKWKLLVQYNCLGPVVRRGGRLLLRGRLREFARKLMKGLPDSRTMRIEVTRAAETTAAWWRRRSFSADQIAALRTDVDAIANPVPIAVFIPVDPTRLDHARQAAASVCRQLYPHWQLRLLWPTPAIPPKLASAIRGESRAKVVAADGLAEAVRAALVEVPCDQVVVLPPDWELTEHALLRYAEAWGRAANEIHPPCPPLEREGEKPTANNQLRCHDFVITSSRPAAAAGEEGIAPALLPAQLLRDCPPTATAVGIVRWATSLVPAEPAAHVPEPLHFPLDGTSLLTPPTVDPAPATGRITLAADICGISGWDAVSFQVLKGLSSAGLAVSRHPAAVVRQHLLPPKLPYAIAPRSPADGQLAIAPPFLLKRYAPDVMTAVYTMWEADRLDPAWVPLLNAARVVIVPTQWAVECFRAAGVTSPLPVVPLGYDPLVFHANEPSSGICTFGTAGALGAGGIRKNLGRVVEAFRAAFPAETDVRLRVKITPNCPPFEIPEDSRIDVIRAVLPHAEVAAWNRSLTAYVNTSYAEGFGLHLLEAMACGRPLISSNYSGPGEFFDESVGYVLPYKLFRVSNEFYTGHWAEPDFDALVAAMRNVHRDRATAETLGLAAAARARSFTWRDTGRGLLAVLDHYGLLR